MNFSFQWKKRRDLICLLAIAGLSPFPTNFMYASNAHGSDMQVAQRQVTIQGSVTDQQGETVIGASIIEKGTKNGTITDLDGKFTIQANPQAVLVISFVGYQTQEVKLKGRTSLNIALQEDAKLLDEVIVTGYGTQRKASLTSAISQIRGEEAFKDRGVSNPTVALQGEIPGLVVTRTSTRPGSENAAMKIRGDVSINGNSNPLVLIDGMTSSLDELNAMEPNDIDNISVLKDASAAIYGSRSASGVILVTTKRGQKGQAKISYSGSISTTINGIRPQLTTNAQWLDMFYEAQYNDAAVTNPDLVGKTDENGNSLLENASGFWWVMGLNGVMTGTNVETNEPYYGRTFWEALRRGDTFTLNNNGIIMHYQPDIYLMDELYGQAFSHRHNVNISGADDKFSYMASLGYADNQSQLKVAEDGEKKYSARLNMDFQANEYLKFESGMSFEKRNITTPSTDVGAGYMDPWFWPFYNEEGQFYDTFGGRNVMGGLVGGGHINNHRTIFRGNMKMTVDLKKLTPGLSISLNGAYKRSEKEVQTEKRLIQYYDWAGNPQKNRQGPGSLKEEKEKWENYNLGVFVNYQRTFAEAHRIEAMLGMTAENEEWTKVTAERKKGEMFENSGLSDLNVWVGGDDNGASGGHTSWSLLSYIGRLNYGYKDKYLFEVLGRRDGSSKLYPTQRWKNFYSVSGGWVISQENFMKELAWLNFLKVRYNYGKTGSVEGIGEYERYATLKTGSEYFGTGGLVAQPWLKLDGMRSADRTWETFQSHDVGIDVTAFDNRLSATFDWFQKTNEGMFIGVTYPAILGASAPKTNNGRFRTHGWELSLNWRDRIGQVTYHIGGQLSDAKSKVLELENNENVPNEGKNSNRLIGMPREAIYVYATDGLFQTQEEVDAYYEKYYWNETHDGPKQNNILPAPRTKQTNTLRPGARKLVDNNGDGSITKDDLVYAGDAAPHLTFGIKAGLEWKGVDISAFFQGVGNQKVLRTGSIYAPWVVNYCLQNAVFMGKMWSEDNPDAEYAIASRDQNFNKWNYQNKDVSVQDSRYIRLKSLVVGYTFPRAWTQKLAISKLRVYFSGEDLWELTKVKDGYDPEHGEASNTTFPFSRLLSFGIDVTF